MVREKANKVFIGIGSNMGDKEGNVRSSLELIGGLDSTVIEKTSSFYRTEPVGIVDQDWFVNAVIKIHTRISPKRLMDNLLSIEEKLGRKRENKWGPRIIDLDILFYDDFIVDDAGITIPHPHLHERNFVLTPLKEIEPDFIHPVFSKSVSKLYEELREKNQVVKI